MANTTTTTLPPSQRIYPQPRGIVAAYFFLQFFGFASLSVLLWTFVSGRVKRDKTIWNLLAVFMVAAWASSLVFVSGTLLTIAHGSKETPYVLCLVNASFIVGGTTSMSTAALNVVLHILLKIVAAKGRLIRLSESTSLVVWFLVSPWLCWLSFFVATVVKGNEDPEKIYKAVFYCSIDNEALTSASAYVNAIIEVINIIVQITIGVILFRHHRDIKAMLAEAEQAPGQQPRSTELDASSRWSRMSSPSSTTTLGGVSIPLVFRLGLFQICVVAALCVCIATIDDFTSVVGDFSITAIGPLVFFIFASQADVLRSWHLLPSHTPVSTLPFTHSYSHSQPHPNPRPSSFTDKRVAPPTQSSSSSAFDLDLSNSVPSTSSSYDPVKGTKVDPAETGGGLVVQSLPFSGARRDDEVDLEKGEDVDEG